MKDFLQDKIRWRFRVLLGAMMAVGALVMYGVCKTAITERDYWIEVSRKVQRDSIAVQPQRGNILSCEGRLLAGTLPVYRIYFDFKSADADDSASVARTDSVWRCGIDSLCLRLHRFFPERTAAQFRTALDTARAAGLRHYPIWPQRISYLTFQEIKQLPIIRCRRYGAGFHFETFPSRRLPFGELAKRTVGGVNWRTDSAAYGLEMSYDTLLRGRAGQSRSRKILNRKMNLPTILPEDGLDIETTIDVGMQDMAERALTDELIEVNGSVGVAIVMEVKTGDIKAMVNLSRDSEGRLAERNDNAVGDMREPGSVFKTVSLMVALDAGAADTSAIINTGCGLYKYGSATMRDHNWYHGGYGTINLARAMEVSSNIGISWIINQHWAQRPEEYVEGIYKTGIQTDLQLPLPLYHKPDIRRPRRNARGQWLNWSATALPWMSIGYETRIPPINTLTFYNAIANGGRMVCPRFVRRASKNGKTVKEFPTRVIKASICKQETLKKVQKVLEHVVSQGLGRQAGSGSFKVAGKTGTALVSQGKGGYKSGMPHYWLSFAGYFPADRPLYSCIVCLEKPGLPASGGGMSGKVFHHISESIMARYLKLDVDAACDGTEDYVPEVAGGDLSGISSLFKSLAVEATGPAKTWGVATKAGGRLTATARHTPRGRVPNCRGMGLSDAVFALESRGIKVRAKGVGLVKEQSLTPGTAVKHGAYCTLELK